jgi:hypothetical protein
MRAYLWYYIKKNLTIENCKRRLAGRGGVFVFRVLPLPTEQLNDL